MSSARRLVPVLWLVLFACRSTLPPPPPPPRPVAAATCDDVAVAARQRCVDEWWSQAVIACFTQATTQDSANACVSNPAPPAAVVNRQASFELDCAALHSALLDALGGRMAFSSIQGAKLPASGTSSIQIDEYESPLEVIKGHPGTITRMPAFPLYYYRVKVGVEPGVTPSADMMADYEALKAQLVYCLPGDWSADAPDPAKPTSTTFRANADRATLEPDGGDVSAAMRNIAAIGKQDEHTHIEVSIASPSAFNQSWLTLDVLTAGL
jgi:hypothetical protein